jgi:hypothetical protein
VLAMLEPMSTVVEFKLIIGVIPHVCQFNPLIAIWAFFSFFERKKTRQLLGGHLNLATNKSLNNRMGSTGLIE